MVIEPNKPTFGLRLIAVIEAVKGVLGLGLALGLLCFPRTSAILWLAESLHLEQLFSLDTWLMLAFAYAVLRFVEAYGLWLARQWGEWIALLSAAVYIPFIAKAMIMHGPSLWNVVLLVLNLAFVTYLGLVIVKTRRKRSRTGLPVSRGEAVGTPAGGN